MNDLDPKGPDYTTISRIVFECRERQKASGEGDQMLSRWISEALSRHLSTVPDGEGELDNAAVKRAVWEYLLHNGERPERVLGSGHELWETCVPAMTAALAASLSQAGVRVTDEMVDIAFRAHTKASGLKLDPGAGYKYQRTAMRAALEAALSGDTL